MMQYLTDAKDQLVTYCKENPTITSALVATSLLYIVNKARNKYRHSQKQFNTPSNINNKVILVTGCGHGFGHDVALQLSIKHSYRVIATCRTQKSVNEFLSNSEFIANKSTSIVMDVTNDKQINDTKQFVINYLTETNSIFWGLVNNAGLAIYGDFELCPPKFDQLQRDVLLNGPLKIIRALLPLFPGRKNYKPNDPNNKLEFTADGGRIVNVSSVGARCNISDVRYGTCKAAISYATHALRIEVSPLFGIWCSAIEPGGFKTNIIDAGFNWSQKIVTELKENGQDELIDIYGLDLDILKPYVKEFEKTRFAADYQPVLDDIIHALIGRYPNREYLPGTGMMLTVLEYLPMSIVDRLMLMRRKKFRDSFKKKRKE